MTPLENQSLLRIARREAMASRQAAQLGSLLHLTSQRRIAQASAPDAETASILAAGTARLMAEVTDLVNALAVGVPGRTHPTRGAMGAETERSHHCTACRCAEAGIDQDGAEVSP